MVENTCETGSASGTNLTAAISGNGSAGTAFTTVSPSNTTAITLDSTAATHGSLGIKLIASTAATAYLWDLDDTASSALMAIRWYMLWDTMPSAAIVQTPLGIRSTAANLGGIDMDATFHTRIATAAGNNGTYSTNAVTTGLVYRYEITGSGWGTAATAANLNIYLGESMTVAATASLSGATSTAAFQRARFGKVGTTATLQARYDSMKVVTGSNTEIGPVPGGSRLNLIVARRLAPIQAANR